MSELVFERGEERTQVAVRVERIGKDLVVSITNEGAHLGAVAVGEYSHSDGKATVSVITRYGHKDDEIARAQALRLAQKTRRPVCVIVGIHVDRATKTEVAAVVKNSALAVGDFLASD